MCGGIDATFLGSNCVVVGPFPLASLVVKAGLVWGKVEHVEGLWVLQGRRVPRSFVLWGAQIVLSPEHDFLIQIIVTEDH